MSAIKERPILFSAPMVRALFDGSKTQTRRIVKFPKFINGDREQLEAVEAMNRYKSGGIAEFGPCDGVKNLWRCPYGKPGDRLYVRETWGVGTRPCPYDGSVDGIEYRADEAYLDDDDLLPLYSECVPSDVDLSDIRSGWRPSIHMPRWASRLTLEITDVRIERLLDISEADALAEGCTSSGWSPSYSDPDNEGCADSYSPMDNFAALWESINGAGSWDANPFVWVVEFKAAQS